MIAAVMTSRWGWPIAEVLHFSGLCLLFAAVGMFDLRMLGVARAIPLRELHRLVPIGVAGYALSAATGLCFVVTTPDQYVYNPALQTKLSLMALAGANMVLFYRTSWRAVLALSPGIPTPFRARAFAAISLACWIGVVCCGRVITAFRPPYRWCFWC